MLLDRPRLRLAGGTYEIVDGALTWTHFTASGEAVRVDPALLGEHALVRERRGQQLPQLADFDDDGASELVLWPSPDGARRATVLTARDGDVRAYAAAAPLDFDALSSVTLGPQLDMLQHVRHTAPEQCDSSLAATRDVLSFVAVHVGATFQADGDEARAWARAQCPERPAVIVPHHGVNANNAGEVWTEVLRRTACARVWGMTPEAIARTLPARWPAPLSCTSAADLVAFARSLQPPLTLRPMAEVRRSTANANANVQFNEWDEWGREVDDAEYAAPIRAFATGQERRLNTMLAQVVRQAEGAVSIDELQEFFSGFGRPIAGSPRDAWFNTVLRLHYENPNEESLLTGSSRVAHVSATGQVAFDAPMDLERRYESSSLRYVVAAYDYDGDGSSEAVVRWSDIGNESSEASPLSILTARGGVVRPYQPSGGVPAFERIVDVDDDGRPDLVSTMKYSMSADSDGELRGSILSVAHARADGTFSTDDAEARAFTEAQCTAPPERILVASVDDEDTIDTSSTLAAVVCARFYGERAERIVARIYADAADLDDTQRGYLRAIAEAALWRMPYQLAARARVTQRP